MFCAFWKMQNKWWTFTVSLPPKKYTVVTVMLSNRSFFETSNNLPLYMLSPRSGVSSRLGKSVLHNDRGNVNWGCVNYCNINLSGQLPNSRMFPLF